MLSLSLLSSLCLQFSEGHAFLYYLYRFLSNKLKLLRNKHLNNWEPLQVNGWNQSIIRNHSKNATLNCCFIISTITIIISLCFIYLFYLTLTVYKRVKIVWRHKKTISLEEHTSKWLKADNKLNVLLSNCWLLHK